MMFPQSVATHMQSQAEAPDEKLIALIQDGESQSFAILVERYRAKSLRVAYGILHNRADAEDAVQEAFIRIYRNIGRFRDISRFKSWLYKVVINESLRLLKARRTGPDEMDAEYAPACEDVDAEQVMLVRQCLAALPKKLRVVLALRGVDELDYAEIALILSIPVGTVRSRLHEARRIFAGHWKGMMQDEM